MTRVPPRTREGARKTVATGRATVVQEAGVETPHQPTVEVDARLPTGDVVGRRPDEGILMALRACQARLGLIAAAPAHASDAAPDVTGLDVQPKGRAAPAALVAIFLASNGNMLVGLDQLVAHVGAVGRANAASPAVLPHLAAVIAKVSVILYRPDDGVPGGAVPTPRQPAKTTTSSRGSVAAVLPGIPGDVEQLLAEVQLEGSTPCEAYGAGPEAAIPAGSEQKSTRDTARRATAVER